MLDFLRNNAGGLLGFTLIGVLAFVFILSFGTQSTGWGDAKMDDTAISVGGTNISNATMNYAIRLNLPRDIANDSPEYVALRQRVARGLIERQLLVTMAEDAGIAVSQDEAMESIINGETYLTIPLQAIAEQVGPQIQFGGLTPDLVASIFVKTGHRARLGTFRDEKGKFDAKALERTIRYQLNFKEDAFIEEQRLELLAQRMRGVLAASVDVSPTEVRDTYNRENDTATLEYIKLAPVAFGASLQPTDATITAWAAGNAEAISNYYEANKYKYTNVEKSARARHILIKVDAVADEATKAAARARIEQLLAQARAGADFAALAAGNSEDPGSAQKGGDLGYNPRGVMVPAFDEATFALSPGQISDVVETEFGFHIIKLEGFREGTVSLEEATPEIARTIYAEKEGEALAKRTADALLAALKAGGKMEQLIASGEQGEEEDAATTEEGEAPEAVDAAAPAAVPAVDIPDGVDHLVQPTPKELVQAAFTLAEGAIGDKVFNVDGNLYVVRLKERKKPTDAEFAEKKEDIAARLRATRIATWMVDRMNAMVRKGFEDGTIQSKVPVDTGAPPAAKAPVAPASSSPAAPEKSDG